MAATLLTTTDASLTWDAAAAGWNRHSGLVRTWLQSATAAMLDAAGVRAGSRVLDVAAGAGDQSLDIAARIGPTGHMLITDISAGILALAGHKLRELIVEIARRQIAAGAWRGAVALD